MIYEVITHKTNEPVNSDGEKVVLVGEEDILIRLMPDTEEEKVTVAIFRNMADEGVKLKIGVTIGLDFKDNKG